MSHGQTPQDLLNQWNSNTQGGVTYPGCEQWKITFPTGDEEKDLCNDVANNRKEFYYVNNAGNGIVFRAPIRSDNGTTPNSSNVRSELREREVDGDVDVYWTTSGHHVIYVKQAITHLPINKPHLVATQIHGNKSEGIDDAMVVRLENQRLFLDFNGGQLRSEVTIKNNYSLGTVHEVIFEVIDGKHYAYYSEDGNLKNAFTSGNASNYRVTDGGNAVLMDINYGDAYFKAGNYTQSNPSQEGNDTDDPDNYGEVVVYDLVVDHDGDFGSGGNPPTGGGCSANVPGSRTVSNVGQTSATLSWNFDDSFNHYNIRYALAGSTNWTYKTTLRESEGDFTVSGGKAFYNLTGLSNNTAYRWQVRAKCDDQTIATAYNDGEGQGFTTSGNSNPNNCNLPWAGDDVSISNESVTVSLGVVDISCENQVCLSLTAEGLGNMESSDYLNIYYKVNGGAQQTLYSKTDSFSTANFEQCGISGNTLEVIVNGATSVTSEVYNVYNVEIRGDGNGQGGTGSTFTPDPNAVYYIDSPHHNLRLGATGSSEDAFTTSTNTTGANVEWKFVAKGNGFWHVQRAAGGALPRLRTDNSPNADMQATSSSGSYTYYEFEEGYLNGSYFMTLPDGPNAYSRLQVNSSGQVKFVSPSSALTWESFTFTKVTGGSTGNNCDVPWSGPDVSISNEAVSISLGVVDISCAASVCLSLTAEGLGNMESSDYIDILYRVNGGATQTLYSKTDSFQSANFEQCNISGNTLEVIINGATSVTSEVYNVTNIEITGSSSNREMLVEEKESKAVYAYPNPFSSELVVALPDTSKEVNSTVYLIDQFGNIVFTQEGVTSGDTFTITPSIRPGIYYLKWVGATGQVLHSETLLKQ